jgi:UDP-N-acetylglucosamine:LPS N-acetylglucosamine transferase
MDKKINLLVVLSGVEPQRSILEDLLIAQIRELKLTATIVRGIPEEVNTMVETPGIEIIQYANSRRLEELLLSAQTVICRSGYSSVMDLSELGIRAILVPTPGQTEQEYLATYLMEKGYFFSVEQKNFNLKDALQQSWEFRYREHCRSDKQLDIAIAELRPPQPVAQ